MKKKSEAQYFDKEKYEEIYNSIDLKVRGFADIVKLIKEVWEVHLSI